MRLQKKPPGSDTEQFAHKLGGGSDDGSGGSGSSSDNSYNRMC